MKNHKESMKNWIPELNVRSYIERAPVSAAEQKRRKRSEHNDNIADRPLRLQSDSPDILREVIYFAELV